MLADWFLQYVYDWLCEGSAYCQDNDPVYLRSPVMSNLRQPYVELSAPALQHLRAIKQQLAESPLGRNLVELVYLRVSQINGCAFCLDLHSRALRSGGETAARLDTLAGWRLSPHFSARERLR
jgi:AhpD family alkylhydroperoxidase